MLGGDIRQILDIWRGEMKQQPFTDAEYAALPKTPLLGTDAVLMDIRGDYEGMTSRKKIAGARLLVAAAVVEGTVVFVKLVGGAADVEAQREPFLAFLASIRRNS
jgi:hypothetical protein